MACSWSWSISNHICFDNIQSRCRCCTVVLGLKLKPIKVIWILRILSFTEFSSENENCVSHQIESTAYFLFKHSLDIFKLLPNACFKINKPEVIKGVFFWVRTTVDQQMARRKCDCNMTFSWRNRVLLLDLTPIVMWFCEFELKKVIGKLNSLKKWLSTTQR